jgi:catechol 2,3-dioxygenase-like lactoylglutathione lyase family enzyme
MAQTGFRGIMLDHVGIAVSNLDKSRAFFEGALASIGFRVLIEFPGVFGMGEELGGPRGEGAVACFWVWAVEGKPAGGPTHIAFRAQDRKTVDRFHEAALAAGGVCNGKPGLRPHYHSNYYGAFVHDPDGNNIEVVCHEAQ